MERGVNGRGLSFVCRFTRHLDGTASTTAQTGVGRAVYVLICKEMGGRVRSSGDDGFAAPLLQAMCVVRSIVQELETNPATGV